MNLNIIFIIVTAISATVFTNQVYGYIDPYEYEDNPTLFAGITKLNELEKIITHCFDSESPNPVQNLLDRGLVNASLLDELGIQDCKEAKIQFDKLDIDVRRAIRLRQVG